MDERVRPQHAAMHGKKIRVGGMWGYAGWVLSTAPWDMGGPASQVINCRCVEMVVPESHWTND